MSKLVITLLIAASLTGCNSHHGNHDKLKGQHSEFCMNYASHTNGVLIDRDAATPWMQEKRKQNGTGTAIQVTFSQAVTNLKETMMHSSLTNGVVRTVQIVYSSDEKETDDQIQMKVYESCMQENWFDQE